MKRLFLIAFLAVSARAAGPAAPQLIKLEKELTSEQEAQKNGTVGTEQYQLFLKEFRPEFEKTFSTTPPSSENEALHARVLVLLGDHKEAVASLQGALKKNPDDPTLKVSLGRTRLDQKDYAGAVAEANAVLEKDPNNRDAKALLAESHGRVAPMSTGRSSTASQTGQAIQPVVTTPRSAVAFTSTPKHDPIVKPVPATQVEQPEPKEGKSRPWWPWSIPFSGALIGYGYVHGKKENDDVCADSTEPTPEQVAQKEKIVKTAKLAGSVLAAGCAIAAVGPYVVAGAAAFFTGLGPPAAGTLALAGGGTLGGVAALSPAVVTAGANALGATTIVVGEAKVASDYITNAGSNQPESGASTHPNGVYEGSPKHGAGQRGGPKGTISPEPTDGQAALDNSIQAKPTSSARIGVDIENEEYVVLREHSPGRFHGYANSWDELEEFARNALIRAGKATARGRVIKP